MSIYRGPQAGFRGFGIEQDQPRVDTLVVNKNQRLPLITSTSLPPPFELPVGGGLAYDVTTDRVYFSNGSTWQPIATSIPPGTTVTYGFIKGAPQVIGPSSETTVLAWTTAGSATYHSLPEWNLATGEYTASADVFLFIAANISWAGGSNQGTRVMRIQYQAGGVGPWTTVKEVDTQADPNASIETTQECQFSLQLTAGDKARVAVFHDAPIAISLAGGNHNSLSGFTA